MEYHGKVYDPQEKQYIFDKCQFGLNIMKNSVCVGLTMKSIDYFQAGFPIINSIKADTWDLVEEYNIGFNLSENNIEEIANEIVKMNIRDIANMKDNTQRIFNELFSVRAFTTKLNKIFDKLLI